MRYYAHYGHREFILCLGYRGDLIRDYFLNYQETMTNDFTLRARDRHVELHSRDLDDWRITFVDTGLHSNIGERLRRVKQYVDKDEAFLANYADGLSDLDLGPYVDSFMKRDKVACFISIPAPHTFHIVHADAEHHVTKLEHVTRSNVRINGGFFVLRREIFDYMNPGEELVIEPFARLAEKRQVLAVPYDGFWRNMDTFKDRQDLEELWSQGQAPWQVWKR